MKDVQVDILLATYNGAKYIKEQIDSIINQSYQNWRLIFRDDGSTDTTVSIIKEYIEKFPDRMRIIEDSDRGLGPLWNFTRILENSTADYCMFCDQDDVWKPNKVEITLKKMIEIEQNHSKDTPILVHTDLEIVDGQLNTIAASMFSYQNLNPNMSSLNHLMVQNNVTGCTVMINKSLKELSLPISKQALMHDWWIALVAASFGKIGVVLESTIRYRQHGNNDVGAKSYSYNYFLNRLTDLNKTVELVRKNIKQAEGFYENYHSELPQREKEILHQYINLMQYSPVQRLGVLKKNDLKKQGKNKKPGLKNICIASF